MSANGSRLMSRANRIVRASSIEVAAAPRAEPPEPPAPPESIVELAPVAESADALAMRALIVTLESLIEQTRMQRRQTSGELARMAVELAVSLAERLIQSEIAADRQRLDRIVRQALLRLPNAKAITVRAHPDDVALLEMQRAAEGEGLAFRADASCARGQLILENSDFFVEWDTVTCLAELRKVLLEESFMGS
jgi:flagellar biosynthesis/type III secretory pathway protein FliH